MKNTLPQKWDAVIRVQPTETPEFVEQSNRLGFNPVFSRPTTGMVLIELNAIVIPDGYRMYVDQVCMTHYSGGALISTTKVTGNAEDKEITITCQDPTGAYTDDHFSDVYVKVRFHKTIPTV